MNECSTIDQGSVQLGAIITGTECRLSARQVHHVLAAFWQQTTSKMSNGTSGISLLICSIATKCLRALKGVMKKPVGCWRSAKTLCPLWATLCILIVAVCAQGNENGSALCVHDCRKHR
jgi:hypothetical protein